MRSFLRGSLYGGVSATSSWINPQQQQGSPSSSSVSSSSSAAASLPHAQQQHSSMMAANNNNSIQYPQHPQQQAAAAAAFYRRGYPTYLNGANALQQSFNNRSQTPATPANTPVEFMDQQQQQGINNNKELTLEQLPESEYINGKFIMRGRVSKWYEQRGFGFIENGSHSEHQQQFFVHARDLITGNGGAKTLKLGQAVEFEPEQTENGGHAMNVCGLGGAPLQNPPASTGVERPLPTYNAAVESVVKQELSTKPSPVIIASSEEQKEQQQQQESQHLDLPQPRFAGTIAHWTVDKGYGFIEVAGQEEHFFTHIKDFTCAKSNQSPAMPQAGDFVEFTPSYLTNRKRATHVTLPNSVPFEPNAVVVQQQQPKKKAHLSSLARAFALPEKKTVSSF